MGEGNAGAIGVISIALTAGAGCVCCLRPGYGVSSSGVGNKGEEEEKKGMVETSRIINHSREAGWIVGLGWVSICCRK